jgi:hypothetical protein
MVRNPLIIALGVTLALAIFLQVTNQFLWFLGQPAASALPPFEWKPSPSFPSDEVRCLIFHFDNSSGARRALYIADYGGSPSIHHKGLTVFQEGKRERRVSVTPRNSHEALWRRDGSDGGMGFGPEAGGRLRPAS